MMIFRRQLSRSTNSLKLTTNRALRSFSQSSISRQAEPAVDPKIDKIVQDISQLNLLEASFLVSALKTRLNISDIVMAPPSSAATGAATAAAAEAPAPEKPAEQTSFKVTLEKFDPATKAKVIKEIKQMLPGANLVEAKKFVEGAPKVINDNAPKEEAEKIKKALEAVGATVSLS